MLKPATMTGKDGRKIELIPHKEGFRIKMTKADGTPDSFLDLLDSCFGRKKDAWKEPNA